MNTIDHISSQFIDYALQTGLFLKHDKESNIFLQSTLSKALFRLREHILEANKRLDLMKKRNTRENIKGKNRN